MTRKMALFKIGVDRHAEALDVAKRYGWTEIWLIHHNGVGEIWNKKPPAERKPYAQVEAYDDGQWRRVR